MNFAELAALLGSLKTATEIAKFIKDTDLTLEKAETKLKLADLVSTLADARIEAAEVQQALLTRDERIRELEREAKVRASLYWREPCYWMKNAEDDEEPYCQHCHDSSQKYVRLHSDGRGRFECRVCSNIFFTRERAAQDAASFINRRSVISRGLA